MITDKMANIFIQQNLHTKRNNLFSDSNRITIISIRRYFKLFYPSEVVISRRVNCVLRSIIKLYKSISYSEIQIQI